MLANKETGGSYVKHTFMKVLQSDCKTISISVEALSELREDLMCQEKIIRGYENDNQSLRDTMKKRELELRMQQARLLEEQRRLASELNSRDLSSAEREPRLLVMQQVQVMHSQ